MQLQSATIASDWNKALSEALQQQLQYEVSQYFFLKGLIFALAWCLKKLIFFANIFV